MFSEGVRASDTASTAPGNRTCGRLVTRPSWLVLSVLKAGVSAACACAALSCAVGVAERAQRETF